MNRSRFGIVVAATLLVSGAMVSVVSEGRADGDCAVGIPAGGGFGNAGFGAGYSTSFYRGGWVGRGCGPAISCRPVCRPRWNTNWCGPTWGSGWGSGWNWNAGCRPVCMPRPWCGVPAWNPCGSVWNPCGPAWNACGWGGWYGYGGTTWGFRDSVFLSVPAGGGMTFFSGTLVPYPVYGYPLGWGFGGWGNGAWGPWLGQASTPAAAVLAANAQRHAVMQAVAPQSRPVIAAAPRGAGRRMPIRASTAVSRLRAARLVARGDEQLRAAGQDPSRLESALTSYRQAAAAAQDQPDTLIRQALVLVALERRELADAALDQAVAVDGRLADNARLVDLAAARGAADDPVFGRQPADLPPLAARGTSILREIGGRADDNAIAWLADRWSSRWGRGVNAVAANGP